MAVGQAPSARAVAALIRWDGAFLAPSPQLSSGTMACQQPCPSGTVPHVTGFYFASWAARYPSISFFSSSGVSFGCSIESVSLLSLPVNLNGTW